MTQRILKLKKQRKALVLAHYYVPEEVQELADVLGDSFALSQAAAQCKEETLVFCGVSFMAESAKILSPDKCILLPEAQARCPMAEMAQLSFLEEMRDREKDLAVVCYINSTAQIKAHSDVCVTSSNALTILKQLPQKHICFVPDVHLGRYLAAALPDKVFHFSEGFCHVHTAIEGPQLKELQKRHPQAQTLAHPECTQEVLALSDYVGSTSGILAEVDRNKAQTYIICTETGVFSALGKAHPEKQFLAVTPKQTCPDMKKISLEKVARVLSEDFRGLILEENLRQAALRPLEAMMRLAKQ